VLANIISLITPEIYMFNTGWRRITKKKERGQLNIRFFSLWWSELQYSRNVGINEL